MKSINKRKILVGILSIIFLVLLTSIYIIYIKKNVIPTTNSKTSISNMFLPINGAYSIGKGETTPINFTYIYSNKHKDLFKKIDSVNLVNSKSIRIQNYSIKGNGHIGEYHIKTLVINMIGVSKGHTQINEISIQTERGIKNYKIGTLGFNIIDGVSEKPLIIGNMYPVIRDEKNNYMFSLQNDGLNNVTIREFIAELNGRLIFKNKPININPNELKEEEVKINIDFNKSPYAVTVIRPSIYYLDGYEQKVLLPPPTWYGLMRISQKQINKTIKYNL